MSTSEVEIGTVSVDSGQVMLVDPCYLGDWVANGYTPHQQATDEPFSYAAACIQSAESPRRAGPVGGLALVSSTLHGDGDYPVYATLNESGLVTSLTIEFDVRRCASCGERLDGYQAWADRCDSCEEEGEGDE